MAVASALALAVLITGCGNRNSHTELVAAAQAAAAPTQVAGGVVGGSGGSTTIPSAGASGGVTGSGTSGGGATSGGSASVGGGTGAGGDAGGGTAAGGQHCTGDEAPITIASVGSQSGVLGATVGGGPRAVSAWAAWINARGGVNCHQVRHLIADDGADPARHQALLQQMVEREGVIAFVQNNAPLSGPAGVAYIERVGVPVIGSETAQAQYYTSPLYFPQHSSARPLTEAAVRGLARVGAERGLTRMAIVSCVESALCSRFGPVGTEVAPSEGATVVYTAGVTIVAPDYTSQCQAAQQAGAEMLILGVDVNSARRFVRSCESINYHPLYEAPSLAAGNALTEEPGTEGLLAVVPTRPWTATSDPFVAEFTEALAQFAPGLEPSVDSLSGWTSAKVFELAARQLSAHPTSAEVLAGLNTFAGEDLGGVTAPMVFAAGQPAAPTQCWFYMEIRDGAWRGRGNGDRVCQ